jgi:hypothetical protein
MKASSQKPNEIVQELVLEQSPTIVSALPHGMKSFSWLQACIEAAAKQTVWGHFGAPNVNRTLFVETEDPPWLVEARIRWIAKGIGLGETELVPGFRYFCPGAFDLVKQMRELIELLVKHKPDFVVLSTLQNILAGKDWKEPSQMFHVNAAIVQISRHYCPVILITHSPWDSRQRRAAGSVTLTANFPTALHYEKRLRKKSNETILSVRLDSKVGRERDFHLDVIIVPGFYTEPHSIHLAYGGEGRPKGASKEAILEALEENPDAASKEIAERYDVDVRYVNKIKQEFRKK